MIKTYLKKFPHAFRGIIYATMHDRGFRTQIYLGVVLAIGISIFFDSLSVLALILVIQAYIFILITELQNSASESALDRIHPELHSNIRHSKDMAAGSVLIAGAYLLFITTLIILGVV